MSDNTDFLPYIYHEDLYIIQEPEVINENVIGNSGSEISQDEPAVDQAAEPNPVKFLGSNNKGILILANDTESEFLNPQDLDFLMKIVESGLKFSKLDIAIVNCVKYPYWQIFDEVHHPYIVAFGNHQTDLLQGQPKYQVLDQDGSKVLLADDLNIIEEDRDKKMQLWKALQRMFDLN